MVGGGGDQAASAIGNGIVEEGAVSCTVGTSGVVFAYLEKPAYDPAGPRAYVLPCDSGHVARDGRHARRGTQPAVVSKPLGARHGVRRPDRGSDVVAGGCTRTCSGCRI